MIDIVMVQDTHVTTREEQEQLNAMWIRMWGLRNGAASATFWCGKSKARAGVAILINPKRLAEAKGYKSGAWPDRHVAIQIGAQVYTNVYAPPARTEREDFFRPLAQVYTGVEQHLVLAGDFNSVDYPSRDR